MYLRVDLQIGRPDYVADPRVAFDWPSMQDGRPDPVLPHKALRADANPRFDTISRVCKALGVKLVARPI